MKRIYFVWRMDENRPHLLRIDQIFKSASIKVVVRFIASKLVVDLVMDEICPKLRSLSNITKCIQKKNVICFLIIHSQHDTLLRQIVMSFVFLVVYCTRKRGPLALAHHLEMAISSSINGQYEYSTICLLLQLIHNKSRLFFLISQIQLSKKFPAIVHYQMIHFHDFRFLSHMLLINVNSEDTDNQDSIRSAQERLEPFSA